jgi:hypothetical protein
VIDRKGAINPSIDLEKSEVVEHCNDDHEDYDNDYAANSPK